MNDEPTAIKDYDAITRVFEHYINGARSGSVEEIAQAFYEGATIHGYVGEDLFAGPIQNFYEWHKENGPAAGVSARTTGVDLAGTIATARVEIEDWTGHRFTDLFTLLKMDGEWKIISKVFHMHA